MINCNRLYVFLSCYSHWLICILVKDMAYMNTHSECQSYKRRQNKGYRQIYLVAIIGITTLLLFLPLLETRASPPASVTAKCRVVDASTAKIHIDAFSQIGISDIVAALKLSSGDILTKVYRIGKAYSIAVTIEDTITTESAAKSLSVDVFDKRGKVLASTNVLCG